MGKYTSTLRKRIKARLTAPDHVMPPCACLGCGTNLDRATVSDGVDEKPHEGAISICWSCGYIQAFDANLAFRELTSEEIVDIAGAPEIVLVGSIRGPWKELIEKRSTLSGPEIAERIVVILKAIAKAEHQRET